MATLSRRIGPLAVDISAASPGVIERLGDLLSTFPERPDGADLDPGLDLDLDLDVEIIGDSTEHLDLVVNSERRLSGAPLWEIEDRLLSNFNGWLLAREPDRIHIHGGLVSRAGVGTLLVGASGSGKSTFTAHLVQHGWIYHTDETAASVPGTSSWGSYPRPITLKRGSWAVFPDLPTIARAAADTVRAADHERAHLPLRELGGVASLDPVPVGVVAFVDHRLSGDPVELSAMDALTRLVAETLDLERAATSGFRDLVRLVRQARCLALPTADLTAAAERLERERGEAETATLALAALGALDEPGLLPTAPSGDAPADPELIAAASVLCRRADVHGWALAGGGVLHDFRGGVTIQVDEAGMATWVRFNGVSSIAEIASTLAAPGDDAVQEMVAFARHLASLGVLAAAR